MWLALKKFLKQVKESLYTNLNFPTGKSNILVWFFRPNEIQFLRLWGRGERDSCFFFSVSFSMREIENNSISVKKGVVALSENISILYMVNE